MKKDLNKTLSEVVGILEKTAEQKRTASEIREARPDDEAIQKLAGLLEDQAGDIAKAQLSSRPEYAKAVRAVAVSSSLETAKSEYEDAKSNLKATKKTATPILREARREFGGKAIKALDAQEQAAALNAAFQDVAVSLPPAEKKGGWWSQPVGFLESKKDS